MNGCAVLRTELLFSDAVPTEVVNLQGVLYQEKKNLCAQFVLNRFLFKGKEPRTFKLSAILK
jgi:hypothetical protein